MKFTFVIIFPKLIAPYFADSILARAKEKGLFEVEFIDPREFSTDKHKKVDDYQISGGAGLLMLAQPLFDTLLHIKERDNAVKFIFLSPVAKPFVQKDAKRLAKESHLCFVCGRYEGIDERVIETFADEIFCVGDFVLTGGELPALMLCDAISRNIKGVLGNSASLNDESFENTLLEAPAFSKPFEFEKKMQKFSAVSAFLNGNHAIISDLKHKFSVCKTKFFRPTLALKAYLKDKQ